MTELSIRANVRVLLSIDSFPANFITRFKTEKFEDKVIHNSLRFCIMPSLACRIQYFSFD